MTIGWTLNTSPCLIRRSESAVGTIPLAFRLALRQWSLDVAPAGGLLPCEWNCIGVGATDGMILCLSEAGFASYIKDMAFAGCGFFRGIENWEYILSYYLKLLSCCHDKFFLLNLCNCCFVLAPHPLERKKKSYSNTDLRPLAKIDPLMTARI